MKRLSRRRFSALILGSVAAPPALAESYDSAACTRFAETTNRKRKVTLNVNPNSKTKKMLIQFRHKGFGLEFNISKDESFGENYYMSDVETMFRTEGFRTWFERQPKGEWDMVYGQRSKAFVDLEIRDPATGWEWWIEGRPVKDSFFDGSKTHYTYKSGLKVPKQKVDQLMRYLLEKDRTGLEISSAGIAPDKTVTVFLKGTMSSTGLRQLFDGLEDTLQDLKRTATPEKCEGGCFLTTACCTALGRADNGIELSTLRAFRDGWMARQRTGQADIAEYYRIAPAICAAIKADPRGKRELYRIYYGTVLPCVAFIKLVQNRLAYGLYRRLVRRLEAKYLCASPAGI